MLGAAASRQHCHHCGSTQLTRLPWRDLIPTLDSIDAVLVYGGTKPIPQTLTFCGSCGEWLASAAEHQQVEEIVAALRLVVAVPELAGARLESGDMPDIQLHIAGLTFGLEVTAIVQGGEDALSRVRWRRAVERNGRLLRRARGLPSAWVSLRWNPDPPFADANAVAQLFVDDVEAHLTVLSAEDHVHIDVGPSQISEETARYIHGFSVVRTRQDDQWVSGYGLQRPILPPEVQETIDKKADVVRGYMSHPDGLWLLIYAESSNAAQALELSSEAQTAVYTAPFGRVFFLSYANRASDLKLR